jgi:hypothetical protein
MKKILSFDQFLNENVLGHMLAFTFVPVDASLKSTIANITTSDTPLPSEQSAKSYLLIPTTAETGTILFSPYFKSPAPTVTGAPHYITSKGEEGFVSVNHDASKGLPSLSPTKTPPVTAEIPGLGNSVPAIHLKSGSANLLEMLMRKFDWEEKTVSDIKARRKIGSGYDTNRIMTYLSYGTIEDVCEELKQILAVATNGEIGFKLDPSLEERFDLTQDLLDIFKKEPGKFMSMDLPEETFKKVSELAKEQAGEDSEIVSQTIDNLSDLKSSGLFDAD